MAKDRVKGDEKEKYRIHLREIAYQYKNIDITRAQIEALNIIYEGVGDIDQETQVAILEASYHIHGFKLSSIIESWNSSDKTLKQGISFRFNMWNELIDGMSYQPETNLKEVEQAKKLAFRDAFYFHRESLKKRNLQK